MIPQLPTRLSNDLFRNFFHTHTVLDQPQLAAVHDLFFEILSEMRATQEQRFFCSSIFQGRITPAPPFSRELQAYIKLYFLQHVLTEEGTSRRFQVLYNIDPENFLKDIPQGLIKQTLYALTLDEIDALIEKRSRLVQQIGLKAQTVDFLYELHHSKGPSSPPTLQFLEDTLKNILMIYPKLVLSFFDYILKTPHLTWFIKILDNHRQLRILFSYYPRFKEKIFTIIQERPDQIENLVRANLSHLLLEFTKNPLDWIYSSFLLSPPASWKNFEPSQFRPFFEVQSLGDLLNLSLIRDGGGVLFLEAENLKALFETHEKFSITKLLLEGFLRENVAQINSCLDRFERIDSATNLLSHLILSDSFMKLYHQNHQFLLEESVLKLNVLESNKCPFFPLMSPDRIYSYVLDFVLKADNADLIDPVLNWNGTLTPLSQILQELESINDIDRFFVQDLVEILEEYPLITLASFFLTQQANLSLSLVLLFKQLYAEKGSLLAPLMTKEHLKFLIQEEGFSKVPLFAEIFRDVIWSEYLSEMIHTSNGLFHLDSKIAKLNLAFEDLQKAQKKGWYEARLHLNSESSCFDTVTSNLKKINDALKENNRNIPMIDIADTLDRFFQAQKWIHRRLKGVKDLPSIPLEWTCPLSMEMIFRPVRLNTVDPYNQESAIEPQIYDETSILEMIGQQSQEACSPLTRRLLAKEAIIFVEDWTEQENIRGFFESLP